MKTPSKHSLLTSTIAALATGLILSASTQAQITGVNSAVSSSSIQFDDTTSFDPSSNPGITNTTLTLTPWPGFTTHSFPSTTDPVTFDNAAGGITAGFGVPGPNDYDITFSGVSHTQAPLNTGTAHLIFTFVVEFQIGALGLPFQPTLFPSFSVNGTVQPVGGFAFVGGFINYDAVNTAGTISTIETVNYNQLFNVPGPFAATVPGVPTFGNTPALVANTTLTLSGTISFQVDPASINAQSQMVPEPSSALLALLSLPLLLRRRRRA